MGPAGLDELVGLVGLVGLVDRVWFRGLFLDSLLMTLTFEGHVAVEI